MSDEQREVAEDTIADVDASGLWPGKVVTEIAKPSPSGRPRPSTRTTSSVTRRGTPAISRGRDGSCRTASPRPDSTLRAAEAVLRLLLTIGPSLPFRA